MRVHLSALVPVLPMLLAGCRIDLRHGVKVDGVRLPAHHEEVLTVASWPAEGLNVAAQVGDVRVEYFDGPTTITLEVHERTLGEAHAHLEDGRLLVAAPNQGVCALGRCVVRTRGPIQGLELETGCGDVEVVGVEVTGRVVLSTGKGDVTLRRAGRQDSVVLDTGLGDISVAHCQCAHIAASTGMGDVTMDDVEALEASLESGLGDVEVTGCKGGRIKADTGLGDIEIVESNFEAKALDTGMGSVRSR